MATCAQASENAAGCGTHGYPAIAVGECVPVCGHGRVGEVETAVSACRPRPQTPHPPDLREPDYIGRCLANPAIMGHPNCRDRTEMPPLGPSVHLQDRRPVAGLLLHVQHKLTGQERNALVVQSPLGHGRLQPDQPFMGMPAEATVLWPPFP